jgi:hypothetical protein
VDSMQAIQLQPLKIWLESASCVVGQHLNGTVNLDSNKSQPGD